jgi:nucleotidyltransferase substrate binding protein (TIGR01987 family)
VDIAGIAQEEAALRVKEALIPFQSEENDPWTPKTSVGSNVSTIIKKHFCISAMRWQRPLSELEELGLIHVFDFTHELAWNVMKDYFEYQGNKSIAGARDATREVFQRNLVTDDEGWMQMIQSWSKTLLTYNPEVADEIAEKVIDVYHDLFTAFEMRMQDLKDAC